MDCDISVFNKGKELPFLEQIRTYADDCFPNCDQKSYRIPAIHFGSERLERQGEYFVQHEQDIAIQKGEKAEQTTIEILEKMKTVCGKGEDEPMFLISDFKFQNYLNKCKTGEGQTVEEGEHDILLLHLDHGITFIEVKGIAEFVSGTEDKEHKKPAKKRRNKHNKIIKEYVEKALEQLDRDEKFFNSVMEDLDLGITIRKVLALPNIRKEYLANLTSVMEVLTKHFGENPLEKCICSDEHSTNNLTRWWENNMRRFPGFPTIDSYKQVIGRYCGLLSTVEVPSSKVDVDYRKSKPEVRTRGDATRELAYRTMRIVLTPTQVDILNSSPRRLKIYGTYGTGKTIMLILKARELMRKKQNVVFFNIYKERQSMLGWYFQECVTAGFSEDLQNNVTTVTGLNLIEITAEEGKKNNFFIDECTVLDENVKKAIQNLHEDCVCWIAHNATEEKSCDEDWCVKDLDVVLRNPQYIQNKLKGYKEVNTSTLFKVDHTKHPSCGDDPCTQCDTKLCSALRELGLFEEKPVTSSIGSELDQTVGAVPGKNLTWSDVVCFLEETDCNKVEFFSRNKIPFVIADEYTENVGNAVIVTIPLRFVGLERKVVITTCFNKDNVSRRIAISRCTSCLIEVNRNALIGSMISKRL